MASGREVDFTNNGGVMETPQVGDMWRDVSMSFTIKAIEGCRAFCEAFDGDTAWIELSWFEGNPFATLVERNGKQVQ